MAGASAPCAGGEAVRAPRLTPEPAPWPTTRSGPSRLIGQIGQRKAGEAAAGRGDAGASHGRRMRAASRIGGRGRRPAMQRRPMPIPMRLVDAIPIGADATPSDSA